jgi:hypothetical protein
MYVYICICLYNNIDRMEQIYIQYHHTTYRMILGVHQGEMVGTPQEKQPKRQFRGLDGSCQTRFQRRRRRRLSTDNISTTAATDHHTTTFTITTSKVVVVVAMTVRRRCIQTTGRIHSNSHYGVLSQTRVRSARDVSLCDCCYCCCCSNS